MKCVSCGAAVLDGTKFCPDCGARVVTEAELRGPTDITIAWIAEGFAKLGYTTEPDGEDKFFAKHSARSNYTVELRLSLPAITLTGFWGLNPRSKAIRTLPQKLMAANAASYYVTFSAVNDVLCTSAVLHICTKVSHGDLEKFADIVESTLTSVFSSSGLSEVGN